MYVSDCQIATHTLLKWKRRREGVCEGPDKSVLTLKHNATT